MKSREALLTGLILLASLVLCSCASRVSSVDSQDRPPEEGALAGDDEAYRQQILALLGPEADEDSLSVQNFSQTVQQSARASEQETEEIQRTEQQTSEAQVETPLAESLYLNAQARMESLGRTLQQRNRMIDSLNAVGSQLDEEIASLESEMQRKPPPRSVAITRPPERSSPQRIYRTEVERNYQKALGQFHRRRYESAIAQFESLLSKNPTHSMADNCQYWIGECYFGLTQYDDAIAEFLKVFSYEAKDKHDDAQIMIALSYLRKGEKETARAELGNFLTTYPRSEYARKAQALIRQIW